MGLNLAAIIDGHPADATALVNRGAVTTYGELRAEVDRVRTGLAGLGIASGDHVALVTSNTPHFVATYFAVLGLGAVAVPLNPASPAAELTRELDAVRAIAIVVGATARAAVQSIDLPAVGVEHVVALEGVDLPGATALADLPGDADAPVVDVEADRVAVLIFTSGTAGNAKAAMLSHGNLLSNIEQMQRHPGRAMNPSDVALGVLPLFHIFGLNVVLGLSLQAGASVVLVERFDPASALETVARHGVTLVAGAPPMWASWSVLPDADPADMRSVRLAISGAAPLTPEIANAFTGRYGIPIWEGYGLTEASPTVTSSVMGGAPKPGSIGVPIPGVEVKLMDDDGEESLLGDPGEIWVRGPNVFLGYLNDPAATASVLTDDGWLRTGDVAVADDDGYLYIVDRTKDLIIVSGFNVFPSEVEETLLEHPGIADAAVVGVSHPHTGETVKAFVVPRAGKHLEEDEIVDFCAHRLARYKCPTKVMFTDEVPHATTGKVLRRQLR